MKRFRVIEYLVDYSFSRFMIPSAIRQLGADRMPEGYRYELLLAAECELGYPAEIRRDLLKLLDVRARVRCLLFAKQSRSTRFNNDLLYVLEHHAHFEETKTGWLFVELAVEHGTIRCHPYTLSDDFRSLSPLRLQHD